MNNAITTRRLTKTYGNKKVVDSLDLRIPEGCVYGFLGRNGAGKSTTLKMLVGMVQPDYGSIDVLGDDGRNLKPATRERVAYIAEGHPLYDWMTIGEIVNFTRPFYRQWNQEIVDQILDHFDLSRKQRIKSLSKGQRAQVSLVLAIAPDPELLILDDPTLGLDTNVRRDFLESMILIIQRRGRTILFSSHVLGDVERVADRVGVMVDGVLRVDCPTEQFKQSIVKVVAEFDSTAAPTSMPVCPGLLGDWHLGSRREFVFVGFGPEQRAVVETLQPRSIEVHDLNLEDAFIEYTRGQRRPLPMFAGGNGDDPIARRQGTA